jgi:uncharacterized protein YndB with AHSA1/START domain
MVKLGFAINSCGGSMVSSAIQRELYIDASPEIVFEVISNPAHLGQWFSDEACYDPTPGSAGELVFFDRGRGERTFSLTVLEVAPPQTFSFRWTEPQGTSPVAGQPLVVTFELTPSRGGTVVRMTETAFGDAGGEAAAIEEHRRDHVRGWSLFLPNLAPYVQALQARS